MNSSAGLDGNANEAFDEIKAVWEEDWGTMGSTAGGGGFGGPNKLIETELADHFSLNIPRPGDIVRLEGGMNSTTLETVAPIAVRASSPVVSHGEAPGTVKGTVNAAKAASSSLEQVYAKLLAVPEAVQLLAAWELESHEDLQHLEEEDVAQLASTLAKIPAAKLRRALGF